MVGVLYDQNLMINRLLFNKEEHVDTVTLSIRRGLFNIYGRISSVAKFSFLKCVSLQDRGDCAFLFLCSSTQN